MPIMNNLIKAKVNKLINELCITSPGQYSIQEIINARGLVYREEKLTGSIGNIVFNNKHGVVTVSTEITDPGQKRFTAAHELGHFENEKHLYSSENKIINTKYEDILSINVKRQNEKNANEFAAELLMYEPWFKDFTEREKVNYKLLSETAEYFKVSLSAVALRYSEIGHHPIGIVLIQNKKVKWSSVNQYFPFNFKFIKNGKQISKNSYTYDYYENGNYPKEGEDIPADAWFDEDFNFEKSYDARIFELLIPMPRYNSILVLLGEC